MNRVLLRICTCFARPDSDIDGKNVYRTREKTWGEATWINECMRKRSEKKVDYGLIPVPDSGVPAALG